MSNYLRGSDPSRWRTHVAQFAAVRYDNVYPGIGLDFHGAADAGLEYDVRVAAGADPSVVALTLSGARSLAIAPNGDLVLRVRDRQIRQLRPVAWQTIDGKRHDVSVRYSLRGSTVGFRLGSYDRSRPLLIDPKVAYASFLGGSGAEGCAPAPGRDGSLYVVCGTDSTDLPEVGAIQPPGAAPEDAYVAKIDPSGRHLVYATYLGSAGNDEGDAIAVDASGHAYISGFAGDGFPTTARAYDPTSNGGTGCCDDGFVAKLSTDGSRLLYSTFIGGSGAEALVHSRSAGTTVLSSPVAQARPTSRRHQAR